AGAGDRAAGATRDLLASRRLATRLVVDILTTLSTSTAADIATVTRLNTQRGAIGQRLTRHRIADAAGEDAAALRALCNLAIFAADGRAQARERAVAAAVGQGHRERGQKREA